MQLDLFSLKIRSSSLMKIYLILLNFTFSWCILNNEATKSTDCQDDIEGLFDRDGFKEWPSGKRAGGITFGCAAMNDMVRNKCSINANLPRNSSTWCHVKCVNKSYLVRWCCIQSHDKLASELTLKFMPDMPTMSLQFQRQKKSPISYESTSRILLWL